MNEFAIIQEEVNVFIQNANEGAPAVIIPDSVLSSPFQRAYQYDPQAFVHDCFVWRENEKPTRYQDELLAELPIRKRLAVRSPHGAGKTSLAAWLILWFALTRNNQRDKDWKCPTTASAWRQLTKFLWPEVHKWTRRLDWSKVGRNPFDPRTELIQTSLKLKTGEAFALASDDHTSLEGAHADSMLYIYDEAKAVPDSTFDASEGAFMGSFASEAYAFAMSTPGEPVGRFYDIHKKKPGYEDWWVRHITLEEAIAAGRIDRSRAEQRKRQWGANSALYKNRVEGEFCASDEEGVIPLAWVELANERWRIWNDTVEKTLGTFVGVGVDVGGGADRDNTVLARRFGNLIPYLERNNNEDTMETTGRVTGVLNAHSGGRAVVDVIGIGAGVVSRLRELGLNVIPFNASESSDMTDISGELGFANKRTAAWWNFREMLDPVNNHNVAIPPDDTLTGDLTAPHKKPESGGRLRMESKDEIKKRIGRSTDDGDAVVMAFIPKAWLGKELPSDFRLHSVEQQSAWTM